MTEKPTYEELEQRIQVLERAEIELKRSEELFRGLFDNMTSGSAIYEVVNDGLKGSDYIVKGFNNKSLEIEGKNLEDVLGKTLFDLRPNIDDYGLIPAMKKVWETGLSAYYPVKLYKDNKFFNYYENYIFKIPSGEIVTIYSDITERKRIEGSLRESERKYRLIADNSGDVIFTLDRVLRYTYVSPSVYKLRGFRPEEVLNHGMGDTLTPESMKRASELISKQLKIQKEEGYTPVAVELEMLCKDGGTVWTEVKASFLRDDDGNITGILGVSRNITERKQIEQSLYESEARFKALHNASFGGIAIHDKGVILDCNQGLSEITGYSMTELIGMDGLSLIAEKSKLFVMQNILSGYEKPYEAIGLRKNGEEYPMRLEARNIPYKGKNVRVTEFRDITEQKKTEERLRQRSEELKVVLDAIPAFVWIGKDPECNVITGNQYVNELFGIMPETNVSQTAVNLNQYAFAIKHLRTDGTEYKAEELPMQQSIALGRAVSNQEFSYLLPDGRLVSVLGNALPLFDDKGVIRGSVGVFLDITEKKQAEIKQKELEATNLRLQKAESLAQMAGGIAHLFNNYLYAVSGNLELALDDLPEESLIRKKLIAAMKAARRCSDISGSMLTYLGQSFAQTQSLDISKFCRNNLSNFQSSIRNDISIDTNLSDMELIVRANESQMQQILNHLITNAIESIGENKGIISLTTKTIPSTDISKFHLFPVDSKPSAKSYACMEVTDTGCGIAVVDIDKLFDPFFTTKFAGRGLGLPVVSGIVKAWGGCIGVKSKVGHGSTFMVFLPIYVDNSVRQSKKLAQSPQPQQKEFSTVLLVEDHEMVRNMATAMLKRMGFEVISAVNGVEAVEKFKQHKECISCLITDLSMPKLDGWGTLAAIRKIKPNIPAILASGYDEAFAMSRDDSEKPQAFLHKPYSMKDLKGALGQALESLS